MWPTYSRSYLKVSSSSWKTEEISPKGALKLKVPKMPNPPKIGGGKVPKVEEFYQFNLTQFSHLLNQSSIILTPARSSRSLI